MRPRLEDVAGFANLLAAHGRAQRGKRGRHEVALFRFDLERELLALRAELLSRAYAPGAYRVFVVRDPKTRVIHAAPYRDRVVHHALCALLEPVLERGFVSDSYACRAGKGQHRALDRFARFAARYRYGAHLDVRKFFPSVDHALLLDRLARRIRDDGILWLCGAILEGGRLAAGPPLHFPGDDLFAPFDRPRGLPIGNLTSQLFANFYLDAADHFVKERLRVRGYVRYMDDMVLFGDSAAQLCDHVAAVREMLLSLRLRLRDEGPAPQATRAGVTFLGMHVFADGHRRVRGASIRRTRKRLRRRAAQYDDAEITREQLAASLQSTLAHLAHANAGGLARALVREVESALGGRAALLSSPSG